MINGRPFKGNVKVYSGRAPRLKKVIWDSQILANFSNRLTVKSIKKLSGISKKSGSLYVWEFVCLGVRHEQTFTQQMPQNAQVSVLVCPLMRSCLASMGYPI